MTVDDDALAKGLFALTVRLDLPESVLMREAGKAGIEPPRLGHRGRRRVAVWF